MKKKLAKILTFTVIGLLALVLWGFVTAYDILATEAQFNHGHALVVVHTAINLLAVLHQPIDLLHGNLAISDLPVILIGWIIETVYLIGVVGWAICYSAVGYHNPALAKVFKYVGLSLIGVNIWTTGSFLSDGDFWRGLIMACILAFGSAFFGLVATYMVETAVSEVLGLGSGTATATK